MVGELHEYNRTLFVELPRSPVVPDGELGAVTAEAYTRVLGMRDALQDAGTETAQVLAGVQGQIAIATDALNKDKASAEQQKAATIADIEAQVKLAYIKASAQADRAKEVAKVNATGGKKIAEQANSAATATATDQLKVVQGEATAEAKANTAEVAYAQETATLASAVQAKREAAIMTQVDGILIASDALYVGTFAKKLEDFAFDVVHDLLDGCGMGAEWAFPGVGTIVSAVCDTANTALYVMRGRYLDALGSAVAIIPYAGTFLKQGVKLGKPAFKSGAKAAAKAVGNIFTEVADAGFRVTGKYVGLIPAGNSAKQLLCGARKAVTGRGPGCFVGSTEVIYVEPHDGRWIATAGVIFVGVPMGVAAGYGLTRRKKRQDEVIDELFYTDDSDTTWPEDEPMPELDPHSESFEELCDQLFSDNADETNWVEESAIARVERSHDNITTSPSRREGRAAGSGRGQQAKLAGNPKRQRGTPSSSPLGERLGEGAQASAAAIGLATSIASPARTKSQPKVATKNTKTTNTTESGRKFSLHAKVFMALGLLFWLFAFSFSLYKGLNSPHVTTKPIDQFQVGTVVPPDKLHGDNDLLYGETVNPKTWRHLFVEGKKKDGSRWDADILVPIWWIEERRAEVGGQVHISVPECGIDGNANVVSLKPCPSIHDTDGRVVTAVYRHHSASVLDLYVEGLDAPIGTTANHPFWSVDRATFVRADSLVQGEKLRLIDGRTVHTLSLVPRSGQHTVYNLQVSVDHVYHVSEAGVLVHNANANGIIGDVAEHIVKDILTQHQHAGWKFIGQIQNGSGHGIDMVFRNKSGYVFLEVKANSSRLSKAQKDFAGFVRSRLDRAASPNTWKHVDPALKTQARKIQRDIAKGVSFRGFEVRVDICGGKIKWKPWK